MNSLVPATKSGSVLLLASPPVQHMLLALPWQPAVSLEAVADQTLAGLALALQRSLPEVLVVELAPGLSSLDEVLGHLGGLALPWTPAIAVVCADASPEAGADCLVAGASELIFTTDAPCLIYARLARLLATVQAERARQGLLVAVQSEVATLKAQLAVADASGLARQVDALQQQLSEQKRYFTSILSYLPLPVLVVDAEGRCTHWNPAGERAFGVRQQDCIGRTDLWRFLYDEPTELLAQKIARGSFTADDPLYRDYLTVLSDPEVYVVERYFPRVGRYLSVTASPIHDAAGRVVGAIETIADISVIKQREEEALRLRQLAQEATDSKSRFLANMSHEIRTPMNAIIGMLDLCLKTPLDERQSRYLNKIRMASDSLLHIINEILDFSKIEAGKMELEEAPFVLENVFEQLSAVLALRAEQQGIELNYDIENDSRVLLGDPLRLGQLLINLLSNAIKFSAGGRVLVRVRDRVVTPETVELQFSVEDNGIGMSAEQVEKIFLPFSQADASTTRKYGGTGLGLAICNLIVQQMGGRIWVESELGQGSCFHFVARFRNLRPDRRSGIAALAAKLADRRERPVLIADDNRVSREIIARIVGHLGLTTCQAESGEAALELVAAHAGPPFLAAFIDWKMPGICGLETMDRLRAALRQSGGEVPPMILVTAFSHHEELHNLVGRIDSLLPKPVAARQLYVELSNCLGLSTNAAIKSERRGTQLQNWRPFQQLDILVAEDIEVNREVIGELLDSVGLQVRFAENGEQLLAAVADKCPDIVLMDCQMPVMDGYEATRRLRELPETALLPVIALTANASFEDKARCHFAGMTGHIAKPFRLEDIYTQLMQFFPSLAAQSAEVGEAPENDPVEFAPLSFAGVEFSVGLAQTGGKIPMYLRVLKKYRDTHVQDFARDYRQAAAQGDSLACIRFAHSLKGVSLTLGVSGVGEAAKQLEHALRDADQARAAQAFEVLLAQLAVVAESLQALEAQEQRQLVS